MVGVFPILIDDQTCRGSTGRRYRRLHEGRSFVVLRWDVASDRCALIMHACYIRSLTLLHPSRFAATFTSPSAVIILVSLRKQSHHLLFQFY